MSFHPSSEFLLIPPFFSHFSPSSLCPSLYSPHDLSFIPVSFFFLSSFFSLTSSLYLLIPPPFFLPFSLLSFPSPFYHSLPSSLNSFQSLPSSFCPSLPPSPSSSICPSFPSVPPFYHPSDTSISLLPMHQECGKEESKRGGIEKNTKDAKKHHRNHYP